MRNRLRQHIQGNVVGYLALMTALSGTAYAVDIVDGSRIRSNSITSQQIKVGTITSEDIRNRTLRSADFAKPLPSSVEVFEAKGSGPLPKAGGVPLVRLGVPPGQYLVWASVNVEDAHISHTCWLSKFNSLSSSSTALDMATELADHNSQFHNTLIGHAMVSSQAEQFRLFCSAFGAERPDPAVSPAKPAKIIAMRIGVCCEGKSKSQGEDAPPN